MSFANGFLKTAGFGDGVRAAGSQTVKDVLKLKGLRDSITEISKSHSGKMKQLLTTPAGRDALYEAAAKSAPSLAAATVYGVTGKKVYDKYYKKDPQAEMPDYYYG
jgi:hypothetical protein